MARGALDPNLVAFIERELGRLTSVAVALTGRRIDADDLVQETMTKVVREWAKVEQARAPAAYVRTMMVHEFIKGRRRKSATELVSSETVDTRADSAADPTVAYLRKHELLRHVQSLPPRQRAVMVLRFLEDASVADVAETLGLSQSSVRVLTHRAITALRAAVPEALLVD